MRMRVFSWAIIGFIILTIGSAGLAQAGEQATVKGLSTWQGIGATFQIEETEAETMVEPEGMADDFGWKAVMVVEGGFGIHPPSLPNQAQLD